MNCRILDYSNIYLTKIGYKLLCQAPFGQRSTKSTLATQCGHNKSNSTCHCCPPITDVSSFRSARYSVPRLSAHLPVHQGNYRRMFHQTPGKFRRTCVGGPSDPERGTSSRQKDVASYSELWVQASTPGPLQNQEKLHCLEAG